MIIITGLQYNTLHLMQTIFGEGHDKPRIRASTRAWYGYPRPWSASSLSSKWKCGWVHWGPVRVWCAVRAWHSTLTFCGCCFSGMLLMLLWNSLSGCAKHTIQFKLFRSQIISLSVSEKRRTRWFYISTRVNYQSTPFTSGKAFFSFNHTWKRSPILFIYILYLLYVRFQNIEFVTICVGCKCYKHKFFMVTNNIKHCHINNTTNSWLEYTRKLDSSRYSPFLPPSHFTLTVQAPFSFYPLFIISQNFQESQV